MYVFDYRKTDRNLERKDGLTVSSAGSGGVNLISLIRYERFGRAGLWQLELSIITRHMTDSYTQRFGA